MERKPHNEFEPLNRRQAQFHEIAPSIISSFEAGANLAVVGLLISVGGKILERGNDSKAVQKYKYAGLAAAGLGVLTALVSSFALFHTGTEIGKAIYSDYKKLGYSDREVKNTFNAAKLLLAFQDDPHGFGRRLKAVIEQHRLRKSA